MCLSLPLVFEALHNGLSFSPTACSHQIYMKHLHHSRDMKVTGYNILIVSINDNIEVSLVCKDDDLVRVSQTSYTFFI